MLYSNNRFNSFAQHRFPHSSFIQANESTDMMLRLANLSNQQQWILYTAECQRPKYQELAAYHIQCDRIIHMKPSQYRSELDIAIQAIQSGNASAVVASNNISPTNQKLLIKLGQQHHCAVFFECSTINAVH
ncbi:hypothetical protein [Vibrio nitrifigilis]|uniref:Superfamily II DNA and RNA helicase n=1 Tax=Vibrio nitrifigilis TaxID=2789781 RepID=A0ABS0GCG9_9VIBR|nr:hypothetical protein [Vibrio nitrifigilis]MBF9000109.1 hypothetical protein [Vibrio nitrifigilis]